MTDKFKPALSSTRDRYLNAVLTDKHFLTLEEEIACGKVKDQAAIDRLVTSHLALAASLARKFSNHGVAFDDMLQEANLALILAANKFDPDRGRFSTIATIYINSALYEFTARSTIVRAAISKPRRKLFFGLKKLKDEILSTTGRKSLSTANIKAIAEQLDVTEFDVREMDVFVSNSDISLSLPVANNETSVSLIDFLADSSYEPSWLLEQQQQEFINGSGIKDAIEELDDREKMIIRGRYGLAENEGEMTLHDLSAIFGVSSERIRQIEARAIAKIHSYVKMFDVCKNPNRPARKHSKPNQKPARVRTPEQLAHRREYDRKRNLEKKLAARKGKEKATA